MWIDTLNLPLYSFSAQRVYVYNQKFPHLFYFLPLLQNLLPEKDYFNLK